MPFVHWKHLRVPSQTTNPYRHFVKRSQGVSVCAGSAGLSAISTGSVHTSGVLGVTTDSNANLAQAVQSGLLSSQGGAVHTTTVQSHASMPVQANSEAGATSGCLCVHIPALCTCSSMMGINPMCGVLQAA